jgi:hypothetical protein
VKITHKTVPVDGGPERAVSSITITLAPGDDPLGMIGGIILRDRLEAFLRVYATPGDLGNPADAADAVRLLAAVSEVYAMTGTRLEAMQLAARDQWNMGWGSIATAMDRSRSTVKGQVQAIRRRYEDDGLWYDLDGLHCGDRLTAAEQTGRAWDADGREPFADDDDPEYRPRVVASCTGCPGRGTGDTCCVCGLPIPAALRRQTGDPSEL